jgi:trk system potassium uptake protein
MHIIVVGCGKVGSRFAQLVYKEGHDVAVVDNDAGNFKRLDMNFGGIIVKGVPIDQDVLKRAGVEIADVLVAVTNDDNLNIMVCQIARTIFSVKRAVARIYSPQRAAIYSEDFNIETFCPTIATVEAMHALMLGDKDVAEHVIGANKFIFRHEKVHKKYEDKKLSSLIGNSKEFVFGIIHDEHFLFANPNIRIKAGDVIVFADRESKGEHI